ncbi:hypothetical protein HNP00_001856 [Arthrobacter sp. AZCC_0090]|nr:hypothetical protein [Arthrobacter sp. AZCC_0090]
MTSDYVIVNRDRTVRRCRVTRCCWQIRPIDSSKQDSPASRGPQGPFNDQHAYAAQMHLDHIDSLNQPIVSLRDRIDSVMAPPAWSAVR